MDRYRHAAQAIRDCEREFDKLEASAGSVTKVEVTRAELDFINGNYDASYERMKKFHAANPTSNLPEMVMARWAQSQGDADKTAEWVKKAAELYPEVPTVQFQYANYAVGQNMFPQANSAIQKIEAKLGETPETVNMKARIAFAGGAYGMAEAHFKKLTQLQPKSFDAANMYALALIESESEEKQKQAGQIASRNYQAFPNNQAAQAAFGWVLWRMGQKAQAQQLLTRAARSPQLAPEVAYFLATMMHSNGNSQQAKLMLQPALDTKGLFLYRAEATRLMKAIDAAGNGG